MSKIYAILLSVGILVSNICYCSAIAEVAKEVCVIIFYIFNYRRLNIFAEHIIIVNVMMSYSGRFSICDMIYQLCSVMN